MNIVGGRQFVEIPGERMHELPPLLIRSAREAKQVQRAMQMASHVVESEEMLPQPILEIAEISELLEQRKMELALQLVEQYYGLINQWRLAVRGRTDLFAPPVVICPDLQIYAASRPVASQSARSTNSAA